MGQKINPNGFRLGITTDHVSHWVADSHKEGQRYADFLKAVSYTHLRAHET